MENDPNRIADILACAPICTRLALTSSNDRLVRRGALRLAELLLGKADQTDDPRQLPLRLD